MKITIEDRNHDGRGRARVGRRTALVSQAHPGEEVVMRLDRKTRGTLQGRVQKLLHADPQRVGHSCRHEFRCTGCALLATSRQVETGFKESRLRGVLAGLQGRVPDTDPLVVVNGPFGYRHYGKAVLFEKDGGVGWGSYVAGTHTVVPNSACPVLAGPLWRLFGGLVAEIRRRGMNVHRDEGERGPRYATARLSRAHGTAHLVLVTSSERHEAEQQLLQFMVNKVKTLSGASLVVNQERDNVILSGPTGFHVGEETITDALLGFEHEIGPQSFFQVNPEAAEVLLGLARDLAGEGDLCLETHSGVGALTLPLAERFRRVIAVESSSDSCSALSRAAGRHAARIGQVDVRCGKVEEQIEAILSQEAAEVVVLDPPRAGLGSRTAGALAASRVRRVVLLSCGPDTLAGDLPPLLDGGFQVKRVVPVDQFPRTAHIETVTLLERPHG